MITPQQLQVLLDVLRRAPTTLAEQLVLGQVVEELMEQVEPQDGGTPTA